MAELVAGAIIAIGTAVGTATNAVLGGGAIAANIGMGVAFATSFTLAAGTNLAVAYGLNKATSALFGGGKKSYNETLTIPTYEFGTTQANSNFSIPMIYGEVKMFGNVIWQDGTQTVHRLISFGDGEIEGYDEDIRLNNIPIANIIGANYTPYYGDGGQNIDDRVLGNSQEEKAENVGELKYDAYLAFTVTANE